MDKSECSIKEAGDAPGLEPGEIGVVTPAFAGELLVFPSYEAEPNGVSYVRYVDAKGRELVRWVSEEWAADPQCVMGAILGAFIGSAAELVAPAETDVYEYEAGEGGDAGVS